MIHLNYKGIHAVAFTAVFLSAISGCVREEVEAPSPQPSDKVRLELYTDQPGYALPATRADEPNEVYGGDPPMVLVYTGTDGDAVFSEAVLSERNGTSTTVTLSKTTSPSTVVIIGNAPTMYFNGTADKTFDAATLAADLDGTTLAQLGGLVQTTKLDVPLHDKPIYSELMTTLPAPPAACAVTAPGGIDENTDLGSASGKLVLSRAVALAEIFISPEIDYLEQFSIGALKASRNGSLYHYSGTYINDPNNVTDMMNTLSNTEGDNAATGPGAPGMFPLYLYECPTAQGTELIFQATYNGEMCYYKLAFTVGGELIPVERNKKYIFTIHSATKGYPTVQEAIAGDPWNGIRGEIEVMDATGHEIVSNGQYYLAVSNSSVVVYGDETDLTEAFTVTTDAHTGISATAGKIVFVVTDGSGTVTASTTTIAIGTSAGTATATPVTVTMPTGVTSATATLTLGNLLQTVTFERRAALSGLGVIQLPDEDYVTCEIESRGTGDWLSVSTDGENEITDAVTLHEPGALHIMGIQLNYEGPQTGGTIYASRMVDGGQLLRSKIYVNQDAIVETYMNYGYVGAFWRHDQTGERLIRNLRSVNGSGIEGEWNATVIAGEEWIMLDTEQPSGGVEWKGQTVADMLTEDGQHQVGGNATTVSGNCAADDTGEIYFRIGLDGTIGPEEHRYGVIRLIYNDYKKSQLLYIRQGEAADYLMRNGDPVPNGAISARTKTVKYSPYNLTAQDYLDGTKTGGTDYRDHSQVGVNGGVFTEYPSQGGAFFQWANENLPTYAWHPTNPTDMITGWDNNETNKHWDALKATNETCPMGYRRPTDGSTSAAISSPAIADSEQRQSLWLNPQTSNSRNNDNSLWGYLADGFFDRHYIQISNTSFANTAVRPNSADVGYIGRLFYNPNNNASLFFPFSGYRVYKVSFTGFCGDYWSASIGSLYVSPTYAAQYNYSRNHAFSVRCVKEE